MILFLTKSLSLLKPSLQIFLYDYVINSARGNKLRVLQMDFCRKNLTRWGLSKKSNLTEMCHVESRPLPVGKTP